MPTKPGAMRRSEVGRTQTPGFAQAGEPGGTESAAGRPARPEVQA